MRELGQIDNNELVIFTTASGREITLWLHECDNCVSLDIHTRRGVDVEPISKNIGNTASAPIGVFAWQDGGIFELTHPTIPPCGVAGKRTPFSAVTVIWNDNSDDEPEVP
jgi:hypothetical protein